MRTDTDFRRLELLRLGKALVIAYSDDTIEVMEGIVAQLEEAKTATERTFEFVVEVTLADDAAAASFIQTLEALPESPQVKGN